MSSLKPKKPSIKKYFKIKRSTLFVRRLNIALRGGNVHSSVKDGFKIKRSTLFVRRLNIALRGGNVHPSIKNSFR